MFLGGRGPGPTLPLTLPGGAHYCHPCHASESNSPAVALNRNPSRACPWSRRPCRCPSGSGLLLRLAGLRGALLRAGRQEMPHSPQVTCGVNMEVRGLFVLKGRWETMGDARASASHSCSLGVCPTHSREVGMVVSVSRGRDRGSGRWSDLPNPTSDPQVRSLC